MSLASLVALAAEEHHENVQLLTLPAFFIAFVIFSALALVTVSFRNVANRHSGKAEKFAERHAAELEHGSGSHH